MALAALRECPAYHCHELTRGGLCDKHERERQRRRERPADQGFYGRKKWKRARAIALNGQPLCAKCEGRGIVELATEVHHIKPRTKRPELAFLQHNLEPLCRWCHAQESRREQHNG